MSQANPDGSWNPVTAPQPQPPYFRGVARVAPAAPGAPRHGRYLDDTDELPPVEPTGRARPGARQRWRTLRGGSGWTMTGLWFAVICWGIWAITDRDLIGAGYALGLVLGTAALVFTVSRLLGRVVLESTLGRARPSAWPSHLFTFLLLIVGGVAFLQQTWWITEAWSWISDSLVS